MRRVAEHTLEGIAISTLFTWSSYALTRNINFSLYNGITTSTLSGLVRGNSSIGPLIGVPAIYYLAQNIELSYLTVVSLTVSLGSLMVSRRLNTPYPQNERRMFEDFYNPVNNPNQIADQISTASIIVAIINVVAATVITFKEILKRRDTSTTHVNQSFNLEVVYLAPILIAPLISFFIYSLSTNRANMGAAIGPFLLLSLEKGFSLLMSPGNAYGLALGLTFSAGLISNMIWNQPRRPAAPHNPQPVAVVPGNR